MSDVDENGIPVVPKRRQRVRVPLEEQLDAPELSAAPEPTIGGVLIVPGKGGWILIDVEVPESQVPRFSTKVREPDMAAIVFAQAEQRLARIVEVGGRQRFAATTKGGLLTIDTALEQLREAIAELHEAYWGEAMSRAEASAALRTFCESGRVESIGRPATGEDRARLQRLVTALGAGEGKPVSAVWPEARA